MFLFEAFKCSRWQVYHQYVFVFQTLFQGQKCTFGILESHSIYHHFTNLHIVNFFNRFIISCIIYFIKITYNLLLNWCRQCLNFNS